LRMGENGTFSSNTAVVGGEMTPARLAQAKAPWITWAPDTDRARRLTRKVPRARANDLGSDPPEVPGVVAVGEPDLQSLSGRDRPG